MIVRTETGSVKLTEVASGLQNPWSLAFLPDGRMLVTERPGRLRIVGRDGPLGHHGGQRGDASIDQRDHSFGHAGDYAGVSTANVGPAVPKTANRQRLSGRSASAPLRRPAPVRGFVASRPSRSSAPGHQG
mgnify:CR=1 FL=1